MSNLRNNLACFLAFIFLPLVSTCRFEDMAMFLRKILVTIVCNTGKIICVVFTFQLCWDERPTQSTENAKCNMGLRFFQFRVASVMVCVCVVDIKYVYVISQGVLQGLIQAYRPLG